MASENAIIGIKEIKMGACGTNGTMGTSLTTLGDLVPDSVNLIFEEPGSTDLYVEDYDTTYYSIPDPAVPRRLEFSSRDLASTTMERAFGGTVINSTRWEAATSVSAIEQSLTAETKVVGGYKKMIYIPRALIRASLDGKMQKKDSAAIKVIAEVLTPFNSGGTALPGIYVDTVAG
jgi:hypothetical protein